MTKKDIIDAYCRIRTIDQTISDEVLDFMKEAAIEELDRIEQLSKSFINFMNIKFNNGKLTNSQDNLTEK